MFIYNEHVDRGACWFTENLVFGPDKKLKRQQMVYDKYQHCKVPCRSLIKNDYVVRKNIRTDEYFITQVINFRNDGPVLSKVNINIEEFIAELSVEDIQTIKTY